MTLKMNWSKAHITKKLIFIIKLRHIPQIHKNYSYCANNDASVRIDGAQDELEIKIENVRFRRIPMSLTVERTLNSPITQINQNYSKEEEKKAIVHMLKCWTTPAKILEKYGAFTLIKAAYECIAQSGNIEILVECCNIINGLNLSLTDPNSLSNLILHVKLHVDHSIPLNRSLIDQYDGMYQLIEFDFDINTEKYERPYKEFCYLKEFFEKQSSTSKYHKIITLLKHIDSIIKPYNNANLT